MNFVPAVVARPGTVRFGGAELACDIDGARRRDASLTLAIRPEDIRVQTVRASEENALRCRSRRWSSWARSSGST